MRTIKNGKEQEDDRDELGGLDNEDSGGNGSSKFGSEAEDRSMSAVSAAAPGFGSQGINTQNERSMKKTDADMVVLEESPEDLASLNTDAAMLERALETDVDAVQELEKQFANLAEMTKMFTQQIDEQHDMVNSIQEDTEDAKDFLDKGVEELNKAKVGRGKHFLSIIFAVLSIVLLFLDWFTP